MENDKSRMILEEGYEENNGEELGNGGSGYYYQGY
jgi:hypothetical protein